jgi:UDP-N-acetylmuramate dehydrogenase
MTNKIKDKLEGVIENEPLSNHTTFRIGGPAKYFYLAKNSRDLLKSIYVAEKFGLSYFVFGWGSNLLVSDAGFDGLVIKSTSSNFSVKGEEIFAEAGVNLSRLVGEAAKLGLSGLEFASGIPGTVGGAARNNAGAYGTSFGDLVTGLEIYQDGKTRNLRHEDMQYHYRDSILKHGKGIIISVKLKLKKEDPTKVHQEVIRIIKQRTQRLPIEPSAGCFFKNVELNDLVLDKERMIKELDITEEEWNEVTKYNKLPVAFIFEKLGLKGKKIGGCQVSEKHAAFFINAGGAKSEHVIMMASDLKMRARNQLGIQLHEEVEYVGF